MRRNTWFAPAKVNLFLHVTGQRQDGYHLLDSLVIFPQGISDDLDFQDDGEWGLTSVGPFSNHLPPASENLVLKAAMQLAAFHNIQESAEIRLTKNLPVASGIGGGSADVAAALKGLSVQWALGLSEHQLEEFGLRFGADVPVCVRGRATRMQGIGEQLSDVPALPCGGIILVNPGVAISTPQIFQALLSRENPPAPAIPACADMPALAQWLATETRNDLEPPAVVMAPAIANVLRALRATALLARMSGSGATCFGLYPTPDAARAAAGKLMTLHPDWWVVSGVLG